MIKVHSYCSYKHSPSGFVYGSFVCGNNQDNTDYNLSENNNNSIVQIAFENGIIRRLCGRIPDSYNYIFLVRKLKYNYGNNHSDIGREVQMNFGFEFDSFDEFLSFVYGFNNAEEQDSQTLYHQLADCVIPDENVGTYKYRISKDALDSWISSIKQPIPNNDIKNDKDYIKGIYVTASSASIDYTEEIMSLFEFPISINNTLVELRRKGNTANYYYPLKKKSQISMNQQIIKNQQKKLETPRKIHFIPIIIVVIVSIALLLVIFGILSLSQQDEKQQIQLKINSIKTTMTNDKIIDESNISLSNYSSSPFQILVPNETAEYVPYNL